MCLREKLERLGSECLRNEKVRIRPILTEADFIYAACDCRLTEEQRELVNPAWFSVGRAYLNREDNYPCIIDNADGEPIGFINFCKWLGEGDAFSWSYYIDLGHQGQGFGKSAARLAVSILKSADPEMPIKLAVEACNTRAQRLYISLGFRRLDETDGDDLVFGL